MIAEKYKELIDKLIVATQQKRIAWDRTSRESEYKANIGSSMVTTDNWDFPDEVMNVDFAIWNSDGIKVDAIYASDGSSDYTDIMRLYSAARASYLKADETIADILKNLD